MSFQRILADWTNTVLKNFKIFENQISQLSVAHMFLSTQNLSFETSVHAADTQPQLT